MGDDWTRFGGEAPRLAQFIGHRAYMRMRDGHCAALERRVAGDGGSDFFCTIYERRPQACRDLDRGSPQCQGELATKWNIRATDRLEPPVSAGESGVPSA